MLSHCGKRCLTPFCPKCGTKMKPGWEQLHAYLLERADKEQRTADKARDSNTLSAGDPSERKFNAALERQERCAEYFTEWAKLVKQHVPVIKT